MEYSLKNIRWIRVIISAFVIIALCYLVIFLVTTIYAFILAFQVRGKPDQVAISHFAATVSMWLMPLLEIILTFLVALVSTIKIEKNIPFNGLIIGILTGLFGLASKLSYGNKLDYYTIILFLIITASGLLGGFVTQKRIQNKLKSPA